MAEVKLMTKCFGEITIDIDENSGSSEVMFADEEIGIFLYNYCNYGEKTKTCTEIINQYPELHGIAKKAILENFADDETIKYYFECHFEFLESNTLVDIFGVDEFQKLDIKTVVEKLKYPDLLFNIENDKIEFSIDYKISKEYSDEILCVKMDEQLNVIRFSHES